jgi:hypothetical protein
MPEITLPDIDADISEPRNASDWWTKGFVAGYNRPDEPQERPLMINDELAAMFLRGADAGKAAAAVTAQEMEALVADQDQIGPDLGGPSLDSVRAQFVRDFGSLFNSEQELHTHEEGPEPMEPLPLPNIVLVE